jgi:hypothetical protein
MFTSGVAWRNLRHPKPSPPRARPGTSFTRIVVLGGLLALLGAALFFALANRPENVKDIVIMSIAAYLAGSAEASRRDEK